MYSQSLRSPSWDPRLWAFSWLQRSHALGLLSAVEGKKVSTKLVASSELPQPRRASTMVRPLAPLPELAFGETAYQQRPLGNVAVCQTSHC